MTDETAAKAFEEAENLQRLREQEHKKQSLVFHANYANSSPVDADCPNIIQEFDDTNEKLTISQGTMTDSDILLIENQNLKEKNESLLKELQQHKWSTRMIENDDDKTTFYTGLPTFAVFIWLFNYLQPKASRMRYWCGENTPIDDRTRHRSTVLSLIDQFFAVLIRLKLGLLVRDVSNRFGISVGTFSKYFNTWINLLCLELKELTPFPSRSLIKQHMPPSFTKYPNTRVILDCTEIFVQRSSSTCNQRLLFSHYKHHTTLKFLVGITPTGVISFISHAWGGKVSDRQITKDSGILDLLEPGDSVMADKGFTIKDLLGERKVSLNIPPFWGKNYQFSHDEIFETQDIAELRIHVERSIGRFKSFHILDGVMPLSLAPFVEQIVHTCAYLSNIGPPLVKK